ncbi:MAG: CoA transferase [Actinomycetia bacterium]|nr:CoA transferase [Actinomycetes bacterium]
MGEQGPLDGVRVLDLTGSTGRFASKVLAELGADVVRVGHAEKGKFLESNTSLGLLDWWYDANCHRYPLDLDSAQDRAVFSRLATQAQLLIEDCVPGYLNEMGLGPQSLAEANPELVHVSLTPYGATGPRAHWESSDLVAQAEGGYLSVTGDQDRPIALWGRQSAVVGGYYAAVSALAGLARVRRTGSGSWIDLSLHEAIISCSEHVLMYWWFPDVLAPLGAPIARRQRSLHWIRAFEVVPCQRGACMISPAAGGLFDLISWLKELGYAQDVPDEPEAEQLLELIPSMMTALRQAALDHDATELFEVGQSLHVPFGEAYSIAQVAQCPQHEFRQFFRPVDDGSAGDGSVGNSSIMIPGPVARFARSPVPAPSAPFELATSDEVLAHWPDGPMASRTEAGIEAEAGAELSPLDSIRVLDFTHVLAGPFATRLFGDLGADVIRIQTAERQGGSGGNEYPYNVMWARNKRSIQLAMKHPEALDVLRQLVAKADVVIDNFSAGVMASWGADPDQLARWRPGLITMAMSGCGTEGPWSNYVTYAPTVHALGGFTALTGPAGETDCGPGIAYNDHVSGLAAATSLMAAIDHRARTGDGQHIDLSQLEIGTHLVGPALIDYMATGHQYESQGNRDPFADYSVNDVFVASDRELVAITIDDDDLFRTTMATIGRTETDQNREPEEIISRWVAGVAGDAVVRQLQAVGVAAGLVKTADHLMNRDPQLAHRDWLRTAESQMIDTQQMERFPGRWHDLSAQQELPLGYRASPYLGQHDFEVYGELLGWDEARVAKALGDELLS